MKHSVVKEPQPPVISGVTLELEIDELGVLYDLMHTSNGGYNDLRTRVEEGLKNAVAALGPELSLEIHKRARNSSPKELYASERMLGLK